ncbi:hypothetical protein IEQ34_008590 [Dendrobium chrysotoxum]|uniref:Large ribosomal subunit protein eL20 domain-containing protein n=1 Tax=Dendrobium chrysotoxum TaxID=161865 RepID=A0AAV7H0N4_DENCH|nr:hypothetical protein IEQ34_008590 [Dendrobium chrysotoxum]
MYNEYKDTTLNGTVEQMYNEMASRHRVRFSCIQIIKTATIPSKLCKCESTKQFRDAKIKFPLVFKKVRPPSRSSRLPSRHPDPISSCKTSRDCFFCMKFTVTRLCLSHIFVGFF